MSPMQTSLTDAFVAAVEKIKRGLFINDLEVGKKIKTQKARLNHQSCCAGENEVTYKLRPKPIIPAVKTSVDNGPIRVKLLPWMYVSTHFSSPFWPKYDIVELPILEFSETWEGFLGDMEERFKAVADLVLVSSYVPADLQEKIWDIRQKVCWHIPEMYGRKGNVQLSILKTTENVNVNNPIADYLRVANLSAGSDNFSQLYDRIVHSTLNQQTHTFRMQVFDCTKSKNVLESL